MTYLDEFDFEFISLDQHGSLAVLTINRPASLNTLNADTLGELSQALDLIAEQDDIGALIVTGETAKHGSKAFVSGIDLAELASLDNVHSARAFALAGQDLCTQLNHLSIPTIAAIDGLAMGCGLELALACDLRVASSTSRLGFPQVTQGMIPSFGGTQRLPRLIGEGRALDLLLTGRELTAEEALHWGLINAISEQPLQRARELAEQTLHAPVALALVKEAIRRGMSTSSLADGLEIEADLFGIVTMTKDFKEGLNATLQKRRPTFKGE